MREGCCSGRGAARGALLGLAAALLGFTPLRELQVEGEYGLHVRLSRDSVTVQWLTQEAVAGRLEVLPARENAPLLMTVPGYAHRVSVPRPRREDVVLRYGGTGRPTFETRILLARPRRPPVEFRDVDSLYVAGDTHGAFDPLVRALRTAGLVGDSLEWTGGRRHLVFAGDLMDRGPHVTRLYWFVYRLEREAARAGGRVHVLLGNHETMVLAGDLRYVHPQEKALAEWYALPYEQLFHTGETVLGQWLASKPAAIRLDRVLVAHAGIVPEYARLSLRDLDEQLAHYLRPEVLYRQEPPPVSHADSVRHRVRDDFFWHPRSLFWYRGYAQADSLGGELDQVLRRYHADVMVVGHTAAPEIQARYDGRLIMAHTARFGAELLLLVREPGQYRRFRIREKGAPEPF